MRLAVRAGVRLSIVTMVLIVAVGWPMGVGAKEREEKRPPPVPAEEYPIYDLVVQSKYLTSQTRLVLIERLTAARMEKDERQYLSQEFLEETGAFGGTLPSSLLDDFFFKLKTPSRLEGRFGFGVPYRFFLDGVPEDPEASLAPIAVSWRPVQEAPKTIGILRFSRVGFTPKEDQALVYVEEERPDGTGGGLLVRLHRVGKIWSITETEVLWMARLDGPVTESP